MEGYKDLRLGPPLRKLVIWAKSIQGATRVEAMRYDKRLDSQGTGTATHLANLSLGNTSRSF